MANSYSFTPDHISTYTPSLRILHYTSVDFAYRNTIPQQVHVVQYDQALPIIKADLYYRGEPYTLEPTDCVNVRFFKPDATFVYNPVLGATADRKSVYIEVTQQMSAAYGTGRGIVEILRGDGVAGTASFEMVIDRNPVSEEGIESTTEFKLLMQYLDEAATYANASRSYAVGDTGTRDGEEVDNSKYYYQLARSYVKGDNNFREGDDTDNGEYYYNLAKQYADNSVYYYDMARSYAVGDNGAREGEETDNAKYYSEKAYYYFSIFHENTTNSEAWAIGERDGIAVNSNDITYHNNSKWYAKQSGELYENNINISEELDTKLGLVSFDVNDDGYLIYTDNSAFSFIIDDDGQLLWEVSY